MSRTRNESKELRQAEEKIDDLRNEEEHQSFAEVT